MRSDQDSKEASSLWSNVEHLARALGLPRVGFFAKARQPVEERHQGVVHVLTGPNEKAPGGCRPPGAPFAAGPSKGCPPQLDITICDLKSENSRASGQVCS